MKFTIASIATAAAAAFTLSTLQPAEAQNFEEQAPYGGYEGDYEQDGDWHQGEADGGDWYEGEQGRYQGQQGGYYDQQGGYQNQQGGNPSEPGRYQGQQGGYQNQQGDYQGQQGNDNPFGQPMNPPGSQVVQLVDQRSPYGAVVAFEHAIPRGWQANGQVTWTQRADYAGCGYDDQYFKWSARSPDGRQEMGYWPQVMYSGAQGQYLDGNPNRGCENIIVGDPKTFFTQHVGRVRPGARIKSYLAPTQQEYAVLRQALPPASRMAPDTIAQWDMAAALFVITYKENGVSYDERVITSAVILDTKVSGMLPMRTQMIAVLPTYYMRAPSGELNETMADAFANSKRDNPDYLRMLKSISDAKSQKNAQRMIAASKARMAANKRSSSSGAVDFSTADIQAEGWKKRTASSNAFQERMAASAGGVVRYNDPQSNTGYFETAVGVGDRVFRQDDGSTVVTDDYFYNQGVQLSPAE